MKSRIQLIAVGLMVAVAAFVVGISFGLPNMTGVVAQEEPNIDPETGDQLGDNDYVITPSPPFDDAELVIRVTIPTEVPVKAPGMYFSTSTDAARSVSVSGRYFYHHLLDRYYEVPPDVELVDITYGFISCLEPCGRPPFFQFRRGESIVLIDAHGQVWDDMEGGDASVFPFFTQESSE